MQGRRQAVAGFAGTRYLAFPTLYFAEFLQGTGWTPQNATAAFRVGYHVGNNVSDTNWRISDTLNSQCATGIVSIA